VHNLPLSASEPVYSSTLVQRILQNAADTA
jgi:hypothetical protein